MKRRHDLGKKIVGTKYICLRIISGIVGLRLISAAAE